MLNNPEQELNEETTEAVADSEGATETEALVDAEVEAEEEATEEVEESEEEAESAEDESEDDLYYNVDGEEVSAKRLKEALKAEKDIKSMQADYTRKTQEAANVRKEAEADEARVAESLEMLQALEGEIADLAKSRFDGVDLDDLRETDTAEYLKVKEQMESSNKFLDNLRAKYQKARDTVIDQESINVRSLLGWDVNADKQKADAEKIANYLNKEGIPGDVFYRPGGAKLMKAILEAAEAESIKTGFEKNKKTAQEKRKAAPVKVLKPKKKTAEAKPASKDDWEYFYNS